MYFIPCFFKLFKVIIWISSWLNIFISCQVFWVKVVKKSQERCLISLWLLSFLWCFLWIVWYSFPGFLFLFRYYKMIFYYLKVSCEILKIKYSQKNFFLACRTGIFLEEFSGTQRQAQGEFKGKSFARQGAWKMKKGQPAEKARFILTSAYHLSDH